jgi:hypothetical protein
MRQNVGTIDRTIRAIVGLVIIGAGVMYSSWWGVVGAVLLLTALVGWCPPYTLLGINTAKAKKKKEHHTEHASQH